MRFRHSRGAGRSSEPTYRLRSNPAASPLPRAGLYKNRPGDRGLLTDAENAGHGSGASPYEGLRPPPGSVPASARPPVRAAPPPTAASRTRVRAQHPAVVSRIVREWRCAYRRGPLRHPRCRGRPAGERRTRFRSPPPRPPSGAQTRAIHRRPATTRSAWRSPRSRIVSLEAGAPGDVPNPAGWGRMSWMPATSDASSATSARRSSSPGSETASSGSREARHQGPRARRTSSREPNTATSSRLGRRRSASPLPAACGEPNTATSSRLGRACFPGRGQVSIPVAADPDQSRSALNR